MMDKSKIAIFFSLAVFCLVLLSLAFAGNLKFALGQLLASVNIYSKAEIIDSGGFGNSFALSPDGSPSASYINEKEGLIFIQKNGSGNWKKEIVDASAFAGNETSLAFGSEENPNILYIDKNFFLKLAKKDDEGWQIEKIFAGAALSLKLAFNEKGESFISFWDKNKGAMSFGKKENGEWKIEVIESVEVGWWNDFALNEREEKFYISYYDFKNKDLLCAFFDNEGLRKELVDFEGDVGRFNSIFTDRENNLHISYFDKENSNLKYAKKIDSGWEIETADKQGGERTNISLDKKGNPVISYISVGEGETKFLGEEQVEKNLKEKKDFCASSNSFKLARKNGCFWQIRNIDSGEIGDNSLLIDKEGSIHLLWQNLLSDELKYLNFSF